MKFKINSTIYSRHIIIEISNNCFDCLFQSNIYNLIVKNRKYIKARIVKNIRKEQL